MKKALLLLAVAYLFQDISLHAQNDSLQERTMGEVVISVNKWEEKLNEVPNKIVKVTKYDILKNNPQTSADLLGQSGLVFIQKSQLGGGSPMIRGFATNRVLLVADGVRMNNAIYRSGNLQNVISIDALSTETAEVIFGPGSLIYGSDAIGGVMDFHSLEARFSDSGKMRVKGSALARYSSANQEKTGHIDLNLGWKKWSWLGSISYSDFDDLKMGRHGGEERYLRTEYVSRINNRDSIIPNREPRIQRFSGYNQLNILQKIRFKPAEGWNLQYSFTHARTGDAPRYDRLIQYRNGALRFAEWHYGPMIWNMHSLHVLHTRKSGIYDESKLTVAIQNYEESRVDRTRNSINRNIQTEMVDAFSANWDASKELKKGLLFYGIEYVRNKVGSTGERIQISSGVSTPMVSRYPDGSTWSTTGVYGSYKINLHPKTTLSTGLRYGFNTLDANFDTSFIRFPYRKAELRDGALTGNAGIVYRPAESWQLNGNIATGYRMPNVDDIGKLFESAPGNITVPNPNLKSEYAWNFEIGLVRDIPRKFRFELNAFYSLLQDAIVRRPTTFNGQDSILFEGVMSRAESLQNVARATVSGLQVSVEYFIFPTLSLQSHANWITGKETDDNKNEQVPLRHAPPFYGSTHLRYRYGKLSAEAEARYNGTVTNKDLAPSEQSKTDIYARDAQGKPYAPGWYTLGLKASYQFSTNLLLTSGWENITNQRYRTYSSGIVAPGSNLVLSIRVSL